MSKRVQRPYHAVWDGISSHLGSGKAPEFTDPDQLFATDFASFSEAKRALVKYFKIRADDYTLALRGARNLKEPQDE